MVEESAKTQTTHAERVRPQKGGRSLKNSRDPHAEWPATLGEIMEWYTHEVEDVTRAAHLRLQSATKIVDEYRKGSLGLNEAASRVMDHDMKWGHILPGQLETNVRGRTDDEINKAIEDYRAGKGR